MTSHTNPELYELCKEVYEATGWDGDELDALRQAEPGEEDENIVCPLYTSDYLLEKLPRTVENVDNDGSNSLEVGVGTQELWEASYANAFHVDYRYTVGADTPLIALLKLTLALHKAGELK